MIEAIPTAAVNQLTEYAYDAAGRMVKEGEKRHGAPSRLTRILE